MLTDRMLTFTQWAYVYSSCPLSAVRPTIEYSCPMMPSTTGWTSRFAWRRSGRPVWVARSRIFLVPSTARQNTFFARPRSEVGCLFSSRLRATSSASA